MTISLSALRQSAAELLACAFLDVFPGASLAGGGTTEFDFYYDFIAEQPIDEQAIPWLEEKMRALIKQGIAVRTLEMMRENAALFFEHRGQNVLADTIRTAPENIVPIFQLGSFYDYCPPPYIQISSEIAAFKLLEIESDGVLKRVRGVVCRDKYSLKKNVKAIAAGKKVDHQRLGQELDLFRLDREINPHTWVWLPKGTLLRNILLKLWEEEHRNLCFKLVTTPPLIQHSLVAKTDPNSSPIVVQGMEYNIPTSLAPVHAQLFASTAYTYRDLPVRLAECAYTLKKQPEHLWGVLESRLVYADSAHLFCRSNDVAHELISSLQFINKITKMFSLECNWHLRECGERFSGSANAWVKGLESMRQAFDHCGIPYANEKQEGVAHGPMAEAHLIDSLGREWKGPKISIDFHLTERFNLRYEDADGIMKRPVLLVRSLFGSLERLIALLIEHYAGHFPFWLAPEQIRVIAVSSEINCYAKNIATQLNSQGFRATISDRHEPLGLQIKEAERAKVPYMIIVGEKEEKQQLINVRSETDQHRVQGTTLAAFIREMQEKNDGHHHRR